MKISIVTVCFNSEKTLLDTIQSVRNQTYKNIEYIVVDGGSKDRTLQIINDNLDVISNHISEKDNGLYDAMNKGTKLATGDYIGFLNSDDFFYDEYAVENIVKEIKSSNADCVFSDLVYIDEESSNQKILRYYDASIGIPSRFKFALYPAHPTFYAKLDAFKKFGGFKIQFKVAADFDLIARFLYTNKLTYSYIQKPLVKMRMGGESTGIKSLIRNTQEQYLVCKENKIPTSLFLILFKYPVKLIGVLKKRQLLQGPN